MRVPDKAKTWLSDVMLYVVCFLVSCFLPFEQFFLFWLIPSQVVFFTSFAGLTLVDHYQTINSLGEL